MVTSTELAKAGRLRPIEDVAEILRLRLDELLLHGPHIAKVRLSAVERAARSRQGKLVLVTGTTPTRYGEGKTVTTIGLGQALSRMDVRATVTLREPSLGPVFGTKGGATGSGRAQVLPMEDINLAFTGDFPAVTAANNLIAAVADAAIFHGNPLDIDPARVQLPRCMDMNDRQLRHIVTGLGGPKHGSPREDGFIITAASEIMAILCLSESLADLKERISRVLVAFRRNGEPVTAKDLRVQGAATILLKDALLPNLVQTTEGGPAIVHGGPFANIAHGHNTILADRLALGTSDLVLTEAGFGADLGGEKFMDLVCPASNLAPYAAVVVASVRSLKHHGGAKRKELPDEDLKALEKGFPNLDAHVRIMEKLGATPVVAVNRFATDTDREVDAVVEHCLDLGVRAAPHTAHADGAAGAQELAKLVLDATGHSWSGLRPVYRPGDDLKEKVAKVATEIYGAGDVSYDAQALEDLAPIENAGLAELPICVAKTQLSLTDDETVRGAPTGWTLRVRGLRASAGAGFLVVLAGDIMRMPGLSKEPAALQMDIDEYGRIQGLF